MRIDQASKRFTFVHSLSQAACAAAFAAVFAGCSSTPKPPDPITVVVNVQASNKINPDSYGRPSPLKVVYYELKSSVTFETADFFALSQNDQGALGGDLLGKQAFFLRPGESKALKRKLSPDTTALCAYVEFRDISNSIWRACTAAPTPQKPGMFSYFQSKKEAAVQMQIDQKTVKIEPATDSQDKVAASPEAAPATSPGSSAQH